MPTLLKRPRILALDLLRGYFLIVILIDHLGLFPSPFEFLSGRGLLWASAAEGFFLISGLLVGYIYTPRLLHHFKSGAGKLLKRAGLLYFWALAITWIMVWWGNHVRNFEIKPGLWHDPPLIEFIYKTFTLQYSYGWADFLQYYAVYMFFAPLALWLCIQGRAWLVIILSSIVWLMRGESFFAAWQLLFMIGVLAGFYFPQLQQWYRNLSSTSKRTLVLSVGILTVATILFSALATRVSVFFIETYPHLGTMPEWFQTTIRWLYSVYQAMEPLTNKWTLEPLRIVIALLWFTALYLFFRRFEESLDRFTAGTLRVIGENSLLVYIVHAFLVYAVLLFVRPDSIIMNSFITALSIIVIYLIARYRKLPGEAMESLRKPRGDQ